MTNTAVFKQTLNEALVQFANADGTTEKDLFTAGANGSLIENIMVSSTDTSDRDVQIFLKLGSTDLLIGTVKIPANSGNTDALPSVNLLASLQTPWNTDAWGNKYLLVSGTNKIRIAMGTTITSGKVVNFFVQGWDY